MIQQIPDPQRIEETTREILSRPEFHDESQVDSSWVHGVINNIVAWFKGLSTWAEASPAAAQVLVIVLTLLLLLIIGHILYVTFRQVSLMQGALSTGNRRAVMVALEGEAEHWDEALALCREALEQGNPRRAIWIMHRLFLSMLDAQGVLRFSRWKTNGDYLLECGREHAHYPTLVQLTDAYEDIVYGHRNTAGYDLEALLQQVTASGGPS